MKYNSCIHSHVVIKKKGEVRVQVRVCVCLRIKAEIKIKYYFVVLIHTCLMLSVEIPPPGGENAQRPAG